MIVPSTRDTSMIRGHDDGVSVSVLFDVYDFPGGVYGTSHAPVPILPPML